MDIPAFIFSNVAYGGCLGLILGACFALVLRTGRQGLLWDAILGAIAFVGALYASERIPTRLNTVIRHVGKSIIRTTARHYQHPYFAAFAATVALVAIHEAVRAVLRARASK